MTDRGGQAMDDRWHIEDVDPDVDEAPPGEHEDCTGDDEDQS